MRKVFHCIATQILGVGAKLVQLPSVALKPKSNGKQSSEVIESPAYQGKLGHSNILVFCWEYIYIYYNFIINLYIYIYIYFIYISDKMVISIIYIYIRYIL